jgi:8-oxo-dGTP pyrophosphatase MutT (NUDIX family)
MSTFDAVGQLPMAGRAGLIEALINYQSAFSVEARLKDRFLDLLKHPRAFFRDHLPGHITGSSWIIDQSNQHVLLTHHAKLNRWLQPGGHADGDENILDVAMKEAREETGLSSLSFLMPSIFDLDIHSIPERQGFPEHDHYDIRIVFRAHKDESFRVSEESHDLAWVEINRVAEISRNNNSMLRMVEKTRLL